MEAMRMRSRRPGRALGFAFGATAAVLAMASVAYACTLYKGKTIITANHAQLGTTTASAEGNGALHGTCPVAPQVDNLTGGASELVMPAQAMHKVAQFTLQVGPTTPTATCPASSAPSDDYDVRWLNLTDNNLLTNLGAICQDTTLPSQDLGNMTVAGGTAGPTAFTQGTASVGDRVNVCLAPQPPTTTTDPSPPEVRLWMI